MNILRKEFLRHVGQTSDSPLMIEIERAEGIYMYPPTAADQAPNAPRRYVDLVSGVSVSNVGHGNRAVVEAVCAQARDYMHLMVYGEIVERPQVKYATLLASLLPEPLDSIYFLNSGAEAIEGALKLAKRHTGRTEMISFRGAYHGSTHGAMSMMGEEFFVNSFRPLLPDVRHIEYNNPEQLEQITTRTACVLVEPVQGEAGVRLPAAGFLEALRERCNAVGAMLIFDEIQTGLGRTGAMFALEKYGVVPDILCLAKALGGGMPLSAFIASRAVMQDLQSDPPLGHITTFGGNPVCCAAGMAALEYILQEGLTDHAEAMGALFEEMLRDHTAVVEIRRSGLLLAIELGSAQRMYAMVKELTTRGYMTDWFLFCDTAFRISPPLTITAEQVAECSRDIRLALDCIEKLDVKNNTSPQTPH